MEERYRKLSEVQLIKLVKKEDNTSLLELLNRYDFESRSLASVYFISNRDYTYLEYDDLLALCHEAVVTMTRNWSDNFKSPRSYWRKVAANAMINAANQARRHENLTPNNDADTVAGGSLDSEAYLLESEIIEIIDNPKNNVSKKEATMFYRHVTGESYEEIASKSKVSYSSARRTVQYVETIIDHIL